MSTFIIIFLIHGTQGVSLQLTADSDVVRKRNSYGTYDECETEHFLPVEHDIERGGCNEENFSDSCNKEQVVVKADGYIFDGDDGFGVDESLKITEVHQGKWAQKNLNLDKYIGWRIVKVNDVSVTGFTSCCTALRHITPNDTVAFTLERKVADSCDNSDPSCRFWHLETCCRYWTCSDEPMKDSMKIFIPVFLIFVFFGGMFMTLYYVHCRDLYTTSPEAFQVLFFGVALPWSIVFLWFLSKIVYEWVSDAHHERLYGYPQFPLWK